MFEKVMYKVKQNTFRIRDFTSGDKVDESKFIKGTNQRGNTQLQTKVCILYKDEYTALNQRIQSINNEVQEYERIIKNKDNQIKELNDKLAEKNQVNTNEVIQLTKEKYNLNQEISNIEKAHLQELEKIKQTHRNQINDIHEKHTKEMESLQKEYTSKIDGLNNKLLDEVKANDKASNDLKKEILDMTKAHQKEINQLQEYISQIKEDNLKEINKKDKAHNDEITKIKNTFLKLRINDNNEDIRDLLDIEDIPFYIKPFVKKQSEIIAKIKKRKELNINDKTINGYIDVPEDN